MRCGLRITLWLALFALVTPALWPASAQATRRPGKKSASAPAEAPRPPVPQELPPVAPTVTYRGGQLTISAQNSTLQDILTAVHKATGAVIDSPASAAGERVATRLGPGPPRDVLAALLNGSRFDYILLSSPQNPGGVRRLILSPRSEGRTAAAGAADSPPGAMSPAAAAFPGPTRGLRPDTSVDENAPEETVEPAEEVAPEPDTQPAPPPQQEIKTPEQLQEELRQHEEQQQQQQQQQPPGQPPQ